MYNSYTRTLLVNLTRFPLLMIWDWLEYFPVDFFFCDFDLYLFSFKVYIPLTLGNCSRLSCLIYLSSIYPKYLETYSGGVQILTIDLFKGVKSLY